MLKCTVGDCKESFYTKKDLREHKINDHTS